MRVSGARSVLVFAGLLAASAAGAADRFVVVTDSHGLGRWGLELETWLGARPDATFDFFASGGSAPLQWLNGAFTTPFGLHETSATGVSTKRPAGKIRTPKLRDLWRAQGSGSANDRRITVIALGTNFHPDAKYRAEEIAETARLIETANAESEVCVWIGPPNMRRARTHDAAAVENRYDILRAAIATAAKRTGKAPCRLVDSRAYSRYPSTGVDGIHYNWPGSRDATEIRECKAWAAGVTAEIAKFLAGTADR